jgi:hypothetical protein
MMPQLRAVFAGLRATVIGPQVNVAHAGNVWNAEGQLVDEKLLPHVETMVKEFVRVTNLLKVEGK